MHERGEEKKRLGGGKGKLGGQSEADDAYIRANCWKKHLESPRGRKMKDAPLIGKTIR